MEDLAEQPAQMNENTDLKAYHFETSDAEGTRQALQSFLRRRSEHTERLTRRTPVPSTATREAIGQARSHDTKIVRENDFKSRILYPTDAHDCGQTFSVDEIVMYLLPRPFLRKLYSIK